MASTGRLDLHVGMPRTATTSIQSPLETRRADLRAAGIVYVGHENLKALPNAAGWMCRRGADGNLAPAFNNDLRTLVGRESAQVAQASGADPISVFVSSEQLTGARVPGRVDRERFRPFTEPAIGQVIEALSPSSVRILLFTRRQDRLMESSYVWRVQKGEHHAFPRQFPYRFEPHLDYVPLIRRIETIVGQGRVTVEPFELISLGAARYLDIVVKWLGASDAIRIANDDDMLTSNRSYSQRAFDIALRLNPLLESDEERRAARGFLFEAYPYPQYPGVKQLGRVHRKRILDVYRPVNEELFKTYMPAFPLDTYSDTNTLQRLQDALSRGAT